MTLADSKWRKVVMAADCEPCPECGEPVCPVCADHYADCECPGPTQDEVEYEVFDGVLYAAPLDEGCA